MAQYPPQAPPPPGAGWPAPDPYAADRALREWVSSRGYELNPTPDLRWFQAWYPCVYAFPIRQISRELRAVFGEARLWIVEGSEDDPVKHATGEDRHLYAFLTSQQLTARSAIRSKSGGGVIDDIGHGLGSLFSGHPTGVLGDPTFEARFDVTVPSRQEGDLALPISLRSLLLQWNWRGLLESRQGGLLVIPFGPAHFDPAVLDSFIGFMGQLHQHMSQSVRPQAT